MSEITQKELHLLEYVCNGFAMMTGTDWRLFLTDAWLGLEDARTRWDPQVAKLTTFAHRRVYGAIQDTMRTEDELPRLHRKRLKEISEGKIVNELPSLRSLQVHDPDHDFNAETSELQVEDRSQQTAARHLEMKDALEYVCKRLNDQEAKVLHLMASGLSMKEVGKMLRVTESRACQVYAKICKALGENAAAQEWADKVLGDDPVTHSMHGARPIRELGRSPWRLRARDRQKKLELSEC